MPGHGGHLAAASQAYGIPVDDWLDLSTGINPVAWPVPALPAAVWQRLPYSSIELEAAARACYGSPAALAVHGSQAAIQLLPQLRPPGRIGIVSPTYAEHAFAWRQAGHQVLEFGPADIETRLADCDVLLLANPNNPTGECYPPARLLEWHAQLRARNGWLVVDEAFMDATPDQSLAAASDRPGLIVLRSVGKFFGLAGLRLGFVLAERGLLQAIAARSGPWPVSGPAQYLGQRALADRDWQAGMRQQLPQQAGRLRDLLQAAGLEPAGGTALFCFVLHAEAADIQAALAALGILVRLFPADASGRPGLRFGLPGTGTDWQRLAAGLAILGFLPPAPGTTTQSVAEQGA